MRRFLKDLLRRKNNCANSRDRKIFNIVSLLSKKNLSDAHTQRHTMKQKLVQRSTLINPFFGRGKIAIVTNLGYIRRFYQSTDRR